MSKEHKKLIITAVIILIAIGTMVWLCYDAIEQREIAQSNLLAEESRLAGVKAKIRKIPSLEKEIEKLNDKIVFYERSLPSAKEAEETLKLIQILLVQTNISIKKLSPVIASGRGRRGPVAKGPYTRHEFSLALKGTYHQISRFISGLEHLQRFTSIETMSFKKSSGKKLGLDVAMTVVTYSFKGGKK